MSQNGTSLLYTRLDSPIGDLLLLGDHAALHGLYMLQAPKPITISPAWQEQPAAFTGVQRQLEEYFAAERESFDLPLSMQGTDFQCAVWSALQEIPYGQTRSYGEIATRVGEPDAARAVGIANARNPISIIVPCHRVIGANGTLTGYGGGLPRKQYLLDLEQAATRPRLSV